MTRIRFHKPSGQTTPGAVRLFGLIALAMLGSSESWSYAIPCDDTKTIGRISELIEKNMNGVLAGQRVELMEQGKSGQAISAMVAETEACIAARAASFQSELAGVCRSGSSITDDELVVFGTEHFDGCMKDDSATVSCSSGEIEAEFTEVLDRVSKNVMKKLTALDMEAEAKSVITCLSESKQEMVGRTIYFCESQAAFDRDQLNARVSSELDKTTDACL